ncbi:hypothetical protein P4O66_007629, partial [Electrophorus voltai]
TLMEQFNPNLQSLVALGNNYIQAFQALAVTSEAYFTALAKMGEQALQTMSSHLLGNILIQISESQRRLTTELEGVFSWFYNEVLREMENNVRLDKDYISASRRHYEMEVRNQATALERQLRRGGSKDGSEYVQFLRESQREALKEQERRYRFLAEKHCGLTQSIVYLINKVDFQGHSWAEQPLGRVPSRGLDREPLCTSHPVSFFLSLGPSPQPVRSRSSSFGESLGVGGARIMRALVPHSSSSNPTLLSFSRGETITVLVSAPQNGWLYGRSENSARQGWFPAEYVGPIEDTLRPPGPGSLRSSSSLSNILDQSTSSRNHAPPPPPPAPPSKSNSSWPVTPTPSEKTRKEGYGPQPELFPRGTNPFATVKLKPTTTNDRSAPCLF